MLAVYCCDQIVPGMCHLSVLVVGWNNNHFGVYDPKILLGTSPVAR